jgi:hypothetical protein
MPNGAQYRQLLEALRKAKKAFDAAKDEGARLASMIEAQRGMILYFTSDPEVVADKLLDPLTTAENVLLDARQGASPALLNHAPAGPKPKATTHERVQASLAWALELLTGPGKLGTGLAAREVAKEARKRGLTDASGAAVEASQIIQCRKDLRSSRASEWATQHWEAFRQFEEYDALLRMPASDLKAERARQAALKLIRVIAHAAPRSAPRVSRSR